jgi:hypothetical protein
VWSTLVQCLDVCSDNISNRSLALNFSLSRNLLSLCYRLDESDSQEAGFGEGYPKGPGLRQWASSICFHAGLNLTMFSIYIHMLKVAGRRQGYEVIRDLIWELVLVIEQSDQSVLLDQFVLVLHNVTNSSLPSSLYQDVCGVLFC